MTKGNWILSILVGLFLLAGCQPTAKPEVSVDESRPTAEEVFRKLEQNLLSRQEYSFAGEITATGAFQAELEGRFEQVGQTVNITFAGSFGGQPVDLQLRSDGSVMTAGPVEAPVQSEQLPHLKEALMIGLTRMGVLHNLARLIEAAPPDHADGGVKEWVEAVRFEPLQTTTEGDRRLYRLDFAITVMGHDAGEVRLWVDVESGLPVRREQVVHFPGGDMNVVEMYQSPGIVAEH